MVDRNTSIRRSQLKPIQYDDLEATNVAVDNYVPSYDEATGKFTWIAVAGGVTNLPDLNDVNFDSGTPADNQVFTYDSASGKWKAEDPQAGLSGDNVDDFTIKFVNNKLKIADRIEINIILNAFRIAINGSLVQFAMVDGIVDEFEDESGIDTGNSINEDYDADNDLYEPTVVAATELDYMEYASDGAAQAAYVTSAGVGEEVDQQTTSVIASEILGDTSDIEIWLGQSFILSGVKTVTAVEIRQDSPVVGSPTGNWTLRIETDDSDEPSGTLAHENASVEVAPPGVNTIVKGTFATPFALSASTTYWIVVQCDSQDTNNRWNISYCSAGDYTDGFMVKTGDGGSTWSPVLGDLYFKVYVQTPAYLQCYSESSIKNQGSYSLKAVAAITNSLNETLTKSGLSIDLSGIDTLKYDIYSASRTGSHIKIGIHDSGGTTTEHTANISSTGGWETQTIDLSGVADANKDDIDSIIITIVNADAANTFYVDNFYAPGVTNDMTLISDSFTAEAAPDDARLVLFEENVDAITENTDIKAYISRDGGSTYAQVTLSDEGDYQSGKRILTGIVDLTQSGIGSGTNIEYKITTHNAKSLKLHGIGLHWD